MGAKPSDRTELSTFKKMQNEPVRLEGINGQYSCHIKMLYFILGIIGAVQGYAHNLIYSLAKNPAASRWGNKEEQKHKWGN